MEERAPLQPLPAQPAGGSLPASLEQENVAALAALDRRIVESNPTDAEIFARIRGQIVQHIEYGKDREHLRRIQVRELLLKVGFSLVAVAAGVGLTLGGFPYPGLLTLGAGLYWLAPRFMERVAQSAVGGRQDVE